MPEKKYYLTEEVRLLLLEKYDGTSNTITKLAQQVGVPRFMIKQWAGKMKITHPSQGEWTQAQIDDLYRYLHKIPLSELAVKINRSVAAIRLKCVKLGISKTTQGGYTLSTLAEALGCSHHRVEHWISTGKMRASRRNTERRERDYYCISDAAVRDFIRRYPLEIDPTKADWLWLVDVLAGGENGLGELTIVKGEKDVELPA